MRGERQEIEEIAQARGITRLYHFTPIGNVRSILENGLASRDVLDIHGIEYQSTDRMRLDGVSNAVSLSIHSVNMPMFSRKKRKLGGYWTILELDAKILWTHPTRFCWTNASSKVMQRHKGYLGGSIAFSRMFADKPVSLDNQGSFRESMGRQSFQPTDIQAEVQVYQPISTDFIVDFTVGNQTAKEWLTALMYEVGVVRPVEINKEIFRR